MTTPISHLQEAQKLTADAEVHLFTVALSGNPIVYRFKDQETVTWQGYTYEGLPCTMSGDVRSADDEEGRPTLRVINPAGIFNDAAMQGLLDRALITRKTVLRSHLVANANIYVQRMWYVERIKELISGQMLGLELRSMTDLPTFQVPYRVFIPPEFPTVSM